MHFSKPAFLNRWLLLNSNCPNFTFTSLVFEQNDLDINYKVSKIPFQPQREGRRHKQSKTHTASPGAPGVPGLPLIPTPSSPLSPLSPFSPASPGSEHRCKERSATKRMRARGEALCFHCSGRTRWEPSDSAMTHPSHNVPLKMLDVVFLFWRPFPRVLWQNGDKRPAAKAHDVFCKSFI